MRPLIAQTVPNEKRVAEHLKRVSKTLDDIERIWLDQGKNRYIVGGNQISVADIMACCELEQTAVSGSEMLL